MVLINSIYDISQYVAVVPVPNENSTILVSAFIQYVLTKFVFCYLVALDDSVPY